MNANLENYREEIALAARCVGTTAADLEKRYITTDEMTGAILRLAIKYNGNIPEREVNRLGLTPRHVQVATMGAARVICEQMED
jgi:hypothetical protein